MNRAPTMVRPAANSMHLCRDAVPTLPAKAAPSRGHAGTLASGHVEMHLPLSTCHRAHVPPATRSARRTYQA